MDFLQGLDVLGKLAVRCRLRGEAWSSKLVAVGQQQVMAREDLAIAQANLTDAEKITLLAHGKWARRNVEGFYQGDCANLTSTELLGKLDRAVMGIGPLPYRIGE